MTEKYYVVETDSRNTDTPRDKWVPVPPLDKESMEKIAKAYNDAYGGPGESRRWKVVPEGYELRCGSSELYGERRLETGPIRAGRWHVMGVTMVDPEGNASGQWVHLGDVIGGEKSPMFDSRIAIGPIKQVKGLIAGLQDLLAELQVVAHKPSRRIVERLNPITQDMEEGYAVALTPTLLLDYDWNIWALDSEGRWQVEPSANGRRPLAHWLDDIFGPLKDEETLALSTLAGGRESRSAAADSASKT